MKKISFVLILVTISLGLPAVAAQDGFQSDAGSKPTISQQLKNFANSGEFKLAAMCLPAGEELNGSSKTCYYNCPTGTKSISVSVGQLCPQSIDG